MKKFLKSDKILGGVISGLFIGLFIGAHSGFFQGIFFRGILWGELLFGEATIFNVVLGSVLDIFSSVVLGAIVGMLTGLFFGIIIGIFVSPFNGMWWGGIHGFLVGISLGVIQELSRSDFFWLLFNLSDVNTGFLKYGYGEIILLTVGIFIRSWFGFSTLIGAFIGVIFGIMVGAAYSSLANLFARIIPSTKLAHLLQQSATKRKTIDSSKVL